MAILKKDQPQSSHWYRSDGSPCHRLPRAGGDGLRPTTLRDAKRLRLFPSVTSILGIFAKPQLDKWKMRQVALASMRLDRSESESDDYYADRIIEEAFAQVEEAADLGSRIHDALEKHYAGEPVPDDLTVYTDPVIAWQQEKRIQFIEREKTLVNHKHGFAGTMDVACTYHTQEDLRQLEELKKARIDGVQGGGRSNKARPDGRNAVAGRSSTQQSAIVADSDRGNLHGLAEGSSLISSKKSLSPIEVRPSGIGVIDFKTRKTKPGQPVTPYDGQAMQIAAYAATYWGEENLGKVFGANVYISTTEPGRLEVCSYAPEELIAEYDVFKNACSIWRHMKRFDPREGREANS